MCLPIIKTETHDSKDVLAYITLKKSIALINSEDLKLTSDSTYGTDTIRK